MKAVTSPAAFHDLLIVDSSYSESIALLSHELFQAVDGILPMLTWYVREDEQKPRYLK